MEYVNLYVYNILIKLNYLIFLRAYVVCQNKARKNTEIAGLRPSPK